MTTKFTIDAKGRVPGRVATEVAKLLMGKNRVDFARNVVPDVEVEVVSSAQMNLTRKKLKEKMYYHTSLYPGGLSVKSQEHIVKTKGAKEVLRRAVYGMLPKNKLRAKMMNNLDIKD